ncbi:Puromycin-sensitive aminopeptidase [Porphyridium purpureum]|uniref:Aminopeptidase n=1 Tax=Porphyridium purpureum TaxID=35688 RepID=A0A5J4Z5X1_PORPP|nr:Puromycin-sensitive aminopeptidase [Porphyridium purpureum]|eukprot:POR7840..scf295_1
MAEKKDRVLLADAVAPVRYVLTLEPCLDAPAEGQKPDDVFVFDGHVAIELDVRRATANIEVNAHELTAHSAVLKAADGVSDAGVAVTGMHHDVKKQVLTIQTDKELALGKCVLEIHFKGSLNDKMAGFYRSAYKDAASGAQKYMAVTQFEPTDARRAFPCFDEPDLKAVFSVKLITPSHLDCISNMPVKDSQPHKGDKKIVTFEDSPIMSTYLLAFLVGEFDFVEGRTAEGVLIRVYTLKNNSHLGHFALDVGMKTLSFFTKFFEIPYPLPKLDMIAVPDFSAGAMENWGCVTYRETALLLDPKNSSAAAKSRVAEVVAHELAHQWFGNLVTMEWWVDLWLNEGFATWAADLAVDTMFPDWETWVQFVGGTYSGALRLDALRSSHPIEVPVKEAQEVNEIFDHISYYKGASAIRMLANHLSVEKFRQGLVVYLNRHKYQNTVTEDLWKALEEASGMSVAPMMRSWTKQTGYPVIRVSGGGADELVCSQLRFLSNGEVLDEDKQAKWIVPLSYVTPDGDEQRVVMDGETATLHAGKSAWVKLNSGQSGIYRVCYTAEQYEQLMAPIRSKELGVVDRLGLLMDAMALSRAGLISTVRALDLMTAFNEETDYTCVSTVIGSLHEISDVFGATDLELRANVAKLGRALLAKVTAKVGWTAGSEDGHVGSLLRSAALTAMQGFDDPATVAEAQRRFAEFEKDNASLPADLRIPVFFAAVKNGGKPEYEVLRQLHDTSDLNEERVRCLRAMAKTKDLEQLKTFRDWGTANVKAQDMMYVMSGMAANPLGIDMAWEYLKTQWNVWLEKYGSGNFMLTRFMELATSGFVTESKAKDVEEFFKTVDTAGVERKLAQCTEGIRVRAAWVGRDQQAVADWLKAFKE